MKRVVLPWDVVPRRNLSEAKTFVKILRSANCGEEDPVSR